MEGSAVVTNLRMSDPSPPSSDDAELWSRVRAHLADDIPLQLLLLRPWRWLNHKHATRDSRAGTQGATILLFPGTTRNRQ